MKRICFITDGYPSETREANAFVETLVNEMVDTGIECVVIAPQSITKSFISKDRLEKRKRIRTTPNGKPVTVYSPKYISASVKKIGGFNTAYITLRNYQKAVERIFDKLFKSNKFDAIYGHFIFPAGITVNYLGEKYSIPSYFAYGENTTYSIDYLGVKQTRQYLTSISGVIAVSSENKRVLIENSIVPSNKIGVFPNAIQNSIFYKKDKREIRRKFGFPENAFIVAFVGRFCDIKGPDRLSKALNACSCEIYSIFIGKGPLKPSANNTLFEGRLEHSAIAEYLNCSDVFVLPTRAEGCCNAIIEALACGLPVISSDLPFNDDILDETCSILIDPNNVEHISEAIMSLYLDRNLLNRLSDGAIQKASTLTIKERAKNIISFMEEKSR